MTAYARQARWSVMTHHAPVRVRIATLFEYANERVRVPMQDGDAHGVWGWVPGGESLFNLQMISHHLPLT